MFHSCVFVFFTYTPASPVWVQRWGKVCVLRQSESRSSSSARVALDFLSPVHLEFHMSGTPKHIQILFNTHALEAVDNVPKKHISNHSTFPNTALGYIVLHLWVLVVSTRCRHRFMFKTVKMFWLVVASFYCNCLTRFIYIPHLTYSGINVSYSDIQREKTFQLMNTLQLIQHVKVYGNRQRQRLKITTL